MNLVIWNIIFKEAIYIYLLPIFLIIFYFLYLFFLRKNSIIFLYIEDLKSIYKFWYIYIIIELILISLIISVFFIIFADPNKINVEEKIKKNGIDIVFAFDVSYSMWAEDIYPNRLDWAKKVIIEFLDKLKTDRAWLVVFAWRPYSSVPLTFDYNILKETFNNISLETLNQSSNQDLAWTAIWDAILLSNNLFINKDLKWSWSLDREKVIILLSDWDATKWVDPLMSALSSKEKWIRIYTIWIWSENWYISNFQHIPPLNDSLLKELAKNTNWQFFRVVDNNTLSLVFKELEKLEKNDIEIKLKKNIDKYYLVFVYILIFLLIIFLWFKLLIFRKNYAD